MSENISEIHHPIPQEPIAPPTPPMQEHDLKYVRHFCQTHSLKMPSDEELLVLNVLLKKRTQYAEDKGLRAFYTSDPIAAETYSDLIAKTTVIRRDKGAYTMKELARTLTKTLERSGKRVDDNGLSVGKSSYCRHYANGYRFGQGIGIGGETALVADKAVASTAYKRVPQKDDSLLLLLPGEMTEAQFVRTLEQISALDPYSVYSIPETGLLAALARFGGVYMAAEYLPGYEASDVSAEGAELLNAFENALLFCVPGNVAITLRDQAAATGITASVIGKLTENHFITVRRPGNTPYSLSVQLINALSPVLPLDVEIPGNSTVKSDTTGLKKLKITSEANCGLMQTAPKPTRGDVKYGTILLGGTGYATPAGSDASFFRTALLTALEAVADAFCHGLDYTKLTMATALSLPENADASTSAARTMAALLGTYRVASEFGIPTKDFYIHHTESGDCTNFAVFYTGEKPSDDAKCAFYSGDSSVYLLTPSAHNGLVDFDDVRHMLGYLSQLKVDGSVLSMAAVGSTGLSDTVCYMSQNGIGLFCDKPLPDCSFGILVETTKPIQGMQIGVTTVKHSDVSSKVKIEDAPMSLIGYERPAVCLVLNQAMGDPLPAQNLLKSMHAETLIAPIFHADSRKELTKLANQMFNSQIVVFCGSRSFIDQLFENTRVNYARETLLQRGGLILCLLTDANGASATLLPQNHPFFWRGVSDINVTNSIVQFGKSPNEVFINRDSALVQQMLASGVACFQ